MRPTTEQIVGSKVCVILLMRPNTEQIVLVCLFCEVDPSAEVLELRITVPLWSNDIRPQQDTLSASSAETAFTGVFGNSFRYRLRKPGTG